MKDICPAIQAAAHMKYGSRATDSLNSRKQSLILIRQKWSEPPGSVQQNKSGSEFDDLRELPLEITLTPWTAVALILVGLLQA